jgi:hypothetical protein
MNRKATKPRTRRTKRDPSPYPKGWNRKRVQSLLDYYENQTDDQAIAEAEAAYNAVDSTMMQIPLALVPQVQRLISRTRAG